MFEANMSLADAKTETLNSNAYMRNVLGWLETRLARNTLIYLNIAEMTLNKKNT